MINAMKCLVLWSDSVVTRGVVPEADLHFVRCGSAARKEESMVAGNVRSLRPVPSLIS